MIGIYRILNKITRKVYIGSSEIIKNRWKRHKTDLNCNVHHSKHLQRAWNKYGAENFIFSIIEECSEEILLEREQYYKNLYKSYIRKYGYDMCQFAGNCKGIKQSKETIKKRVETNKKVWESKNLKTKFSKYSRNKKKEDNKLLRIQRENRDLEIVKLLKSGKFQDEIAELYNLSPSKITNIKQKYDIQTPTNVRKGSNNNFSKLNESQVVEIKQLLKNKTKQQEIADKFEVSKRTIKAIASGQNWSHITI